MVDRELVELAQRGDREAFTALLRAVGDQMYAVAFRILRDRDLAEDAYQEAMLAAWRQLPYLRDPERFEAWTRRILVHACYGESRKRSAWTAHVRELPADEGPGSHEDHAIHDRDELDRAFLRLTVQQRALFVLHHHVGLPLVELAAALGIPAGTARSRLHYATRQLRSALTSATPVATTKERLA